MRCTSDERNTDDVHRRICDVDAMPIEWLNVVRINVNSTVDAQEWEWEFITWEKSTGKALKPLNELTLAWKMHAHQCSKWYPWMFPVFHPWTPLPIRLFLGSRLGMTPCLKIDGWDCAFGGWRLNVAHIWMHCRRHHCHWVQRRWLEHLCLKWEGILLKFLEIFIPRMWNLENLQEFQAIFRN